MFSKLNINNSLKSIYLFFVTVFLFIFDTIIIALTGKPAQPNALAIVRLDAIGDFILWLDAAKEIKRLYPYKRITLIVNKTCRELAILLPYWDEVISIDRKKLIKNPIYRGRVLSIIRQQGFEKVIQPTFSRELRRGDSIIRATGAANRIGSIGNLSNMNSWEKRFSYKFFTQLLPATSKPLMELNRNAEFMRGLGLQEFTANLPSLPKLMELPDKLRIGRSYYIVFPGAFFAGRRWPAARFGLLLSKLTNSSGLLAVLCGNSQEHDICRQVIHASGIEALNLAGETTLTELVEVIRQAEFLVGNETSAIHIAAAVGTPSACILGGGHYGRFVPYSVEADEQHIAPLPVIHRMDCFNCNWKCTRPHEKKGALPCVSGVKVDQVIEVIEEIKKRFI